MINKVYAASNQAFGGSGAAHSGAFASTHSAFHRSFARFPHHRNRHNVGTFFPGEAGFIWDQSYGQPGAEFTPPMSGPTSGDVNYPYRFDIPWDWVHRYPPGFFAGPSQPTSPPVADVPGCSTQIVTVPGADGKDRTVNLVRC
jgi:hypothetical protein